MATYHTQLSSADTGPQTTVVAGGPKVILPQLTDIFRCHQVLHCQSIFTRFNSMQDFWILLSSSLCFKKVGPTWFLAMSPQAFELVLCRLMTLGCPTDTWILKYGATSATECPDPPAHTSTQVSESRLPRTLSTW